MSKLSNLKKLLPLFTIGLALATLILGTASISWADSLSEEMQDFQHFLNNHPNVAADLQRDPWLANNSHYVNNHGDFKDFLHKHPQVRRQLAANPGYALRAPYAWNRAPYGAYPPYAGRPHGVYPPYTSAPYSVYPPYASRRYGSDRPYNHRPHGDDSHYKAPSEHR